MRDAEESYFSSHTSMDRAANNQTREILMVSYLPQNKSLLEEIHFTITSLAKTERSEDKLVQTIECVQCCSQLSEGLAI